MLGFGIEGGEEAGINRDWLARDLRGILLGGYCMAAQQAQQKRVHIDTGSGHLVSFSFERDSAAGNSDWYFLAKYGQSQLILPRREDPGGVPQKRERGDAPSLTCKKWERVRVNERFAPQRSLTRACLGFAHTRLRRGLSGTGVR